MKIDFEGSLELDAGHMPMAPAPRFGDYVEHVLQAAKPQELKQFWKEHLEGWTGGSEPLQVKD